MARGGDRPGEVLGRRLGRIGHPRAPLRPEVLDDDFLDMPVLALEIGDGEQRVEPFRPGLADADQDAGRKGNGELAGLTQSRQPRLRPLVGRAEMGAPAPGEPGREAFEHDPLRHRNLAQRGDVGAREHARVDVGQQPGLLEHEAGGVS